MIKTLCVILSILHGVIWLYGVIGIVSLCPDSLSWHVICFPFTVLMLMTIFLPAGFILYALDGCELGG